MLVLHGLSQVAVVPMTGVAHDIAIDSRLGMGFVTNSVGNSQQYVTHINLATLTKMRDVDTGGFGPHKAAVDPERHLAYISHAEFNKVTVMDTNTGAMLRYDRRVPVLPRYRPRASSGVHLESGRQHRFGDRHVERRVAVTGYAAPQVDLELKSGVPDGIRTRVLALKGPRPRPLDDGDTEVRNARL